MARLNHEQIILTTVKPPIRWAGSKRSVIEKLADFWPGGATRYIEPFAGSACLFFHIEPKAALLADLNCELIATYRAIARDVELVLECLRRLPLGKKAYYAVRATDPSALSDAEQAARFLYLNRRCFNGLYRTNKRGEFNVPYGPPKGPGRDYEQRLREAATVLRGVRLINADFEVTLRSVRQGDFVYLDPPYVVARRRVFSEYLPGSFSSTDLERLADSIRRLDDAGIGFLVSYGDSREARSLLSQWTTKRAWTRRNIAGFADARRGSYELLASNLPWPE